MSKPKTEGQEWLINSLGAFNGSGYADMDTAEAFLNSYIAYKTMHKKPKAAQLAEQYKQEVLPFLERLLAKTHGAGRQPAQKYKDKFQAFRNHPQARLF